MGANLSPRFDTFGHAFQKFPAIRLDRNWWSHAPPAMSSIRRVRTRSHPDFERELCVNSGGPRKERVREFGPFFRTGVCNLDGCVRETEISLQKESAADWAGEPRKALETRE